MIKSIPTTTWEPRPNWLILEPVTLPEKTEGGIILPDSYTTKANSGVCIKAGSSIDKQIFMGKECFFPIHDEFRVLDSDNDVVYYIVNSDNVMLVRNPAPQEKTLRVTPEPTNYQPLTHHD